MVIMLFKYPQIGRVALLYLLYYLIDAKWLLTVRLQPNLLINFSYDCSAFKSKYAQQTSVLNAASTTVKRNPRGEVPICQTDLNTFRHI